MPINIFVPGKWILGGEHSVLRGVPALVFPLESRGVGLSYEEGGEPLTLVTDSPNGSSRALLGSVLDEAFEILGADRSKIRGRLIFKNSLLIGAGLGASASLCVSIGRWLCAIGVLNEENLLDFSVRLENVFHGESSGVDVAAVFHKRPLKYIRGEGVETLETRWTPHLYLKDSGARGVTSDCVALVKELHKTDPLEGARWDEIMRESVQDCERALKMEDGVLLLAQGMMKAQTCFQRWGLVSNDQNLALESLLHEGALATKFTGSGMGGCFLSLWAQVPYRDDLIPCFGGQCDLKTSWERRREI